MFDTGRPGGYPDVLFVQIKRTSLMVLYKGHLEKWFNCQVLQWFYQELLYDCIGGCRSIQSQIQRLDLHSFS